MAVFFLMNSAKESKIKVSKVPPTAAWRCPRKWWRNSSNMLQSLISTRPEPNIETWVCYHYKWQSNTLIVFGKGQSENHQNHLWKETRAAQKNFSRQVSIISHWVCHQHINLLPSKERLAGQHPRGHRRAITKLFKIIQVQMIKKIEPPDCGSLGKTDIKCLITERINYKLREDQHSKPSRLCGDLDGGIYSMFEKLK